MITNTSNIFQIKETETGYLSKSGVACKAGETYPIYIPRLMPLIKSGNPTTNAVSSRGTVCFKNDSSCKVLTATLMKTQNYIELPFERNKSWKGQATEDDDGIERVSKNTKVVCKCNTNSISNMTFAND